MTKHSTLDSDQTILDGVMPTLEQAIDQLMLGNPGGLTAAERAVELQDMVGRVDLGKSDSAILRAYVLLEGKRLIENALQRKVGVMAGEPITQYSNWKGDDGVVRMVHARNLTFRQDAGAVRLAIENAEVVNAAVERKVRAHEIGLARAGGDMQQYVLDFKDEE